MKISERYYGNHNVYEDENGDILFHLGRMLGSAGKAILLTSVLPNDLTGKTVVVIGTETTGATKSFIDTFINQIILLRNASNIVFIDAPEQFMVYGERTGVNNGYISRLSFVKKTDRV